MKSTKSTFWNTLETLQRGPSSRLDAVKDEVKMLELLADYRFDVDFGWDMGRYVSVTCPFHEDRSPSASIDTEANRLHCFSCDRTWDVVDIVMQEEECSFIEAVGQLFEAYCE